MDRGEMHRSLHASRVARLATVDADGRPHLVPVCFAVVGDTIYHAVDAKPKRTRQLRRIDNITATGLACLLVDYYAEDWSTLWWVRLDCHARLVDDDREAQRAIVALVDKYPQYRSAPPEGPVVALTAYRWRGWSAR